jgi:hypothetical protein
VLDTAPLLSAPGSRNDWQEHGVPGDRPAASDNRLPLEKTRLIPVCDIESAGPQDGAGLRALFESILQWGLLQPLIVRPAAGGRYEVLVGRKRFAAARSAGFTEVPCVVFEGPDVDALALASAVTAAPAGGRAAVPPPSAAPEGAAAVLRELHTIREAVSKTLELEGAQPDGLRQRVARELLAAELQRASWIVDALIVFHGSLEPGGGPVRLGPLLRSALEPFQAECRLGGIEVRVMVESGELAFAAAERPLRCALNCLIGAVLVSMHGSRHPDPRLVIRGSGMPGMGVISLSQNVVPLQALVRLRASARGGGVPVGEPLLASFAFEAARRTVEGVGGRIELRMEAGEPGGSVDLKLPAAGPGASHADEDNPAGHA